MAITKMSNSGIASTGSEKYNDMLAGNPPFIPTAWDSIATVTSSSTSLTFSSIPSTFKHLQIRYVARTNTGAALFMQFNGDSANNYAWHFMRGNGSNLSAFGYASQGQIGVSLPDNGIGVNQLSTGVIDIIDYQSTTKNKTTKTFCGLSTNTSSGNEVSVQSGLWRSTSAINSITIYSNGGSWTSASQFALYGIKG